MSVEEIKTSLNSLSEAERKEITIHLSKLRNAADQEHRDLVTARLDDKDPAHWISLDELKRRFPGEWANGDDPLDPEIAGLLATLDGMFDEERNAGRLDPDKVAAAIRAHRERHPYGK
ncbi:MAG TPA: hypothetical protein VGO11_01795 [Chthoniobacteraceae bacterium]|jgi:hypothetical protein|nr:hypothetical protein [Chthoniobacteraceae bacterium]